MNNEPIAAPKEKATSQLLKSPWQTIVYAIIVIITSAVGQGLITYRIFQHLIADQPYYSYATIPGYLMLFILLSLAIISVTSLLDKRIRFGWAADLTMLTFATVLIALALFGGYSKTVLIITAICGFSLYCSFSKAFIQWRKTIKSVPHNPVKSRKTSLRDKISFFKFKARLNRASYISLSYLWYFAIFLIAILLTRTLSSNNHMNLKNIILVIAGSFAIIAMLTNAILMGIRRLHDFNFRGWWLLFNVIPYFGALWAIAICFIPGSDGNNRFGESQPNAKLSWFNLIGFALTAPVLALFPMTKIYLASINQHWKSYHNRIYSASYPCTPTKKKVLHVAEGQELLCHSWNRVMFDSLYIKDRNKTPILARNYAYAAAESIAPYVNILKKKYSLKKVQFDHLTHLNNHRFRNLALVFSNKSGHQYEEFINLYMNRDHVILAASAASLPISKKHREMIMRFLGSVQVKNVSY